MTRRSTATCILVQWNPHRAPVPVLPCASLAGKRHGTFRPTSTAKSRPSVRTFVPNWKAYKLRTHSCWSSLESTKAQPTGVRVNSTSCSVDRNLSSVGDESLSIPSYTLLRRDGAHCGQTGMGLYVHHSIVHTTKRRADLESERVECMWVEIKHSSSSATLVGYVYIGILLLRMLGLMTS